MIALALLLAAPIQDRAPLIPGGPDEADASSRQETCGPASDEIVVCANRDPSQFRLADPGPRYAPKPVRADFKLPGGGKGEVRAVQRGVGGVSVPSAMVTLTIPLGAKKK